MVVDTSVLVAILCDEPEAPRFEAALERDGARFLSAASLLEAALVIEARFGEAGGRELDLLVQKANLEVVPVDADQVEFAREGYRRFGRGRHPAGLNFGDCFAYALSKARGEGLLFKGNDFSQSDVAVAPIDEDGSIPGLQ